MTIPVEKNVFAIEKGIPVVEAKRRNKYPFADMVPGDSFFIPNPSKGFGTTVRDYSQRLGWNFHYARVDGGGRVWRMPDTPKDGEGK
jgi:hypothetical protein